MIVADECVSTVIVRALRAQGLQVLAIGEDRPGEADPDVLSLAFAQGAILLTEDLDFGELVVRRGHQAVGVIQLRLASLRPDERTVRAVHAVLAHLDAARGALVVVGPHRTRTRPLTR